MNKITPTMTTFTWAIHDYIARSSFPGAFMRSPVFASDESNRILWCLECQTNMSGTNVYLRLVSPGRNSQVNASHSFYLLSNLGRKIHAVRFENELMVKNDTGSIYTLPKLTKNFLENDMLILMCEVNTEHQDNPVIDVPPCNIINDLHELLKEEVLTDIKLKAEKCEFSAHKAMLSARSQVFAAMIKDNVNDQEKGYLEIYDVSSEVLKQMLQFIYTGEAENLKTFPEELLPAADKYGLNRLKLLCEEFLIKTLTIDNAAHRIILADVSRAEQLKKHALDFINDNLSSVMETKDGKELRISYSKLYEEILNKKQK